MKPVARAINVIKIFYWKNSLERSQKRHIEEIFEGAQVSVIEWRGLREIVKRMPLTWARSYKQNLSVNLCYTHFRALLLAEILEQPIRMLKNQRSVILHWKYIYRIGPCSWYYSVGCFIPVHLTSLIRKYVLLIGEKLVGPLSLQSRAGSMAAYGRWRLVTAQMVSCCVYELTKQ